MASATHLPLCGAKAPRRWKKKSLLEEKVFRGLNFLSGAADTVIEAAIAYRGYAHHRVTRCCSARKGYPRRFNGVHTGMTMASAKHRLELLPEAIAFRGRD